MFGSACICSCTDQLLILSFSSKLSEVSKVGVNLAPFVNEATPRYMLLLARIWGD